MSVVHSLAWSMWLQQATLPDTIVTKQIAVRSWWQVLIDVEQAIVPLALLALLLAIAFGVYRASKGIQEVTRLVKESTSDLSGAAHSVRSMAEDIRGITGSVKGDVEAFSDTVRGVNAQVKNAVAHAERRIRRFDAIVDVAQEEVEDFVVSAAATLRGVRQGAGVLRRSFWFARRNGLFRTRRRPRWEERESDEDAPDTAGARQARHDERPRIRTRVPDET